MSQVFTVEEAKGAVEGSDIPQRRLPLPKTARIKHSPICSTYNSVLNGENIKHIDNSTLYINTQRDSSKKL